MVDAGLEILEDEITEPDPPEEPAIDPKLSILTSTKKLLGIEEDYEHFDTEIILYINSVFMILNQLGLGPTTGFSIEDENDLWTDFLKDREDLEGVKSYMTLKVKLMFDPPQMGYLVDLLNKRCEEFEWRLNVQVETPSDENGKGDKSKWQ